MQGFGRMDGELADAAAVAGHLIPAGSMFAFLAAHRAEVFSDADYGAFEVNRDRVAARLPDVLASGLRCDRRWYPLVQAMRTRRCWFSGLRNP